MSRIGKMPIAIPAGVTVVFNNGVVTVKGAKGELSREVVGNIDIVTEGNELLAAEVCRACASMSGASKYFYVIYEVRSCHSSYY